jgi:SHS2 domain-containing protein
VKQVLNMIRYEEISHTADLAARIYGRTIPELFENAAFAMFDMMADLDDLIQEEEVEVTVEAPDPESLLIFWLNEVLYASFSRGMLFSEFRVVSLEGNRLTAVARGGPAGLKNRLKNEIKAATFHDLTIEQRERGFEVTVVFDV